MFCSCRKSGDAIVQVVVEDASEEGNVNMCEIELTAQHLQ